MPAKLEAEMLDKDFAQVQDEADKTWENLLSKIKVEGSTDRNKNIFYTTLYRASLMPRLESDVNGQYRDLQGNIVTDADFRYYSNPLKRLLSETLSRHLENRNNINDKKSRRPICLRDFFVDIIFCDYSLILLS